MGINLRTEPCPGTAFPRQKPDLTYWHPAPTTPVVITEARGTPCHPAGYTPSPFLAGPPILSAFSIILLTNCLWMQVMNGRVITTALATPFSR